MEKLVEVEVQIAQVTSTFYPYPKLDPDHVTITFHVLGEKELALANGLVTLKKQYFKSLNVTAGDVVKLTLSTLD